MSSDEVSKPSSIPPYPEMILSALGELDEKGGSNKSAISKHMECKYGEQLPESHASLLAAHLQRMKDGDELVMLNSSSYARAGPGSPAAPVKRGRGRPPKPRPQLPPGEVLPSPRPRGRPPKPRDPLAAAVVKKKAAAAGGGPGRPRGRPPKMANPLGHGGEPAVGASAAAVTPQSGVKRGRGRPPKVNPPFADVGFA